MLKIFTKYFKIYLLFNNCYFISIHLNATLLAVLIVTKKSFQMAWFAIFSPIRVLASISETYRRSDWLIYPSLRHVAVFHSHAAIVRDKARLTSPSPPTSEVLTQSGRFFLLGQFCIVIWSVPYCKSSPHKNSCTI